MTPSWARRLASCSLTYGMPLYVDMATATTGIGWLKGISLCEVLIQGYDIQTCALGAHSIGESMQASNAGIKLSIIEEKKAREHKA